MAEKVLMKLDNDLWLGIWAEYHSGAAGKASATLRMLEQLDHMVAGYVSQAKRVGGHLSTDVEDFRQSLCAKLISLLSTYDPKHGKFSTYAYTDMNACLSDYKRGGDGMGTAPISPYNAKKGRFVHFDSLDALIEADNGGDAVFIKNTAPSAEDEYFDSLIPEDIQEFRNYIDSLGLSPKEAKEKWRIFMGVREIRF